MAETTSQVQSTIINNRYVLQEALGRGGMGVVYRASDLLSGHPVALKQVTVPTRLLSFDSRGDRGDLALALAQEFRALATMRHPHIISVYDFDFDRQGQPYFTMQYIDGGRSILDAGRDLAIEAKAGLIVQMLQALIYLHRRGILHRDIKPSNALVLDGQLKLLDFGLSVITSQTMEHLTHTTAGTMAYMAPELFQGAPYSRASDLYAAGVIAFELLTGHFPYQQSNLATMMHNVLSKQVDAAAHGIGAGLAGVLNQLLVKSPEARYQDASQVIHDLCAATGSPIPPETEQIRESFLQAAKFVGREAEMAYLTEQMEVAAAGQGKLILIAGESGVGKSRLLDEARIRAMVEGILVLRGQAVSDGRRYYQLWRDVLRQLLLYAQPDEDELVLFQPVVPDLARFLDRPVPDAGPPGPSAHQQQLSRSVIRLLGRLARPVMIILEDLQWAGTESIDLLKELASGLADEPILLAGTLRDDRPLSLGEELRMAEYLRLGRLSGEDIAILSESMLGHAGRDPRITDLLQRETEGNAFFLVETVRALAEEAGQLDRISATRVPEFIMPGGMQAILERRLNRVPEDARPLMQLASVAGRKLDLALLRELEPGAAFDDWLAKCMDASVLEAYGQTWRFSHDKLREAIKEGMSHDLHHELHRRVAEGMEAIYSDAPEYAAALALHWSIAGNPEKELHYTTIAAEQAAASNANQEAIALFERALELLLRQPKNDERDRQELTLQLGLGSELMATQGFNAPEVMGAFGRARELAIRTGQINPLFYAIWGQWEFYVHGELDDLEIAEELVEQLFELCDRSEDNHLLLEAHHAGWTTAYTRGDAAATVKHVRLGLRLYDRQIHQEHKRIFGHDPGVCANMSGAIGLWLLGYPDQAKRSAEKGQAIAEALNHPFSTAVSKWGLAMIAIFREEDEFALQKAIEFVDFSQEYAFSRFARIADIMQGIAYAQSIEGPEQTTLMHELYTMASRDKGFVLWSWVLSRFLEACRSAGSTATQDGLQAVQQELADNPLTGKRLFESEVRRLYGELMLAADENRAPEAEEQFQLARDITRRQSARSLELRVVMSMARLRRKQGRQEEAYRMLAESYGWFSEGFDTADLMAAKEMLDSLAP